MQWGERDGRFREGMFGFEHGWINSTVSMSASADLASTDQECFSKNMIFPLDILPVAQYFHLECLLQGKTNGLNYSRGHWIS